MHSSKSAAATKSAFARLPDIVTLNHPGFSALAATATPGTLVTVPSKAKRKTSISLYPWAVISDVIVSVDVKADDTPFAYSNASRRITSDTHDVYPVGSSYSLSKLNVVHQVSAPESETTTVSAA